MTTATKAKMIFFIEVTSFRQGLRLAGWTSVVSTLARRMPLRMGM
jgi:hypothetical protein